VPGVPDPRNSEPRRELAREGGDYTTRWEETGNDSSGESLILIFHAVLLKRLSLGKLAGERYGFAAACPVEPVSSREVGLFEGSAPVLEAVR